MLARHLIVSVEYRTLYRMKDSNAAYTSHKWSLPTTTSSTHHSLVQQYSNAQWLALSNGIGHCPSDHHPAVLPRRLSCVAVHNDGPTRMEADNASVHHPVVLASSLSSNAAVSPCTMVDELGWRRTMPLPTLQQCSLVAYPASDPLGWRRTMPLSTTQ